MALSLEVIKTPTGFLKICEIVLTIIMLSVGEGLVGSYGSEARTFVVGGAMILSIVVTPLLLFNYIMGFTQIQKTRFEIAVNFWTAVLMITAGSLIINTFTAEEFKFSNCRDAALTTGSFGIINSILYALDAFFAYQNYSE